MKLSSYTEIGKRELNEDFIAHSTQIYVLCDGVGGEEKGEVASCFVADKMVEYFSGNNDNARNKASIQGTLKKIQLELNARIATNPDENGMGTTLTAAIFSKGNAFLAHIGDSRIYYIRPAEGLFWRTTDHSVIAELVMSGMISEAEARNHPMRNRITRAIQSNSFGNTSKADIYSVGNVKAGDLIFLCSDGVLETFSESNLLEILTDGLKTAAEKIMEVRNTCFGTSTDNNSALLIEFGPEDEHLSNQDDEIVWQKIDLHSKDTGNEESEEFQSNGPVNIISREPEGFQKTKVYRILTLVSIAVLTFILFILASYLFSFGQRQKTSKTKSSFGPNLGMYKYRLNEETKTYQYIV